MAASKQAPKGKKQLDRKVSELKFKHNGVNYTVNLSASGFMGLTPYLCVAENGVQIAHGGISRLNYATQRQHLKAIEDTCLKKTGLDEWDLIRYPSLTDEQNDLIRRARRMGFATFFSVDTSTATQDQRTLEAAEAFMANASVQVRELNEKITDALSKGGR